MHNAAGAFNFAVFYCVGQRVNFTKGKFRSNLCLKIWLTITGKCKDKFLFPVSFPENLKIGGIHFGTNSLIK